ncbi:sensor histidine kinase [Phaeacidiphilus oryzae]|uniref:sensor histidine kinase n=1 Tax=Phaeacidiphilus oryzae TaxID=348818 RepID=UPI00126A083C|nr:HAMP domain-containing sensor histidine kinase [Phaeacidiphilus oryzae]
MLASLALTAAVVLGVLLLYQLQMTGVKRTLDGELRTYAVQIAQAAGAGNGTWSGPLPQSSLDPNAEAQVLGADGEVLAATRTLTGLPAVYVLPPGAEVPVRQPAADRAIPRDVRVVAERTVVGGRKVTIVAGTPTGLLHEVDEEFAHYLLIGLPLILALAAGTVWLVVGRALRPVEEIRQAVTDITSADLSQRVPEPGTADEVGHLAQTMNGMLARLDESARRQRRFVADASHELRSPLAAVRTTLEVGLAHPERAPWPDLAGSAVRQSARLEELIRDLLLLAKADERLLAERRHPVSLAEVIDEILAGAPAARCEVRVDVPAEAVVPGNGDHLERLFRNLVDNALRHARHRVAVGAAVLERTVRVEVDDDGAGIPVAERERVFDRFVRLEGSRERGSGTTGLGLAIAREIAIAHHGRIAITTSPAGGARVVVVLPRAGVDGGTPGAGPGAPRRGP